jgi:hypothetical protein
MTLSLCIWLEEKSPPRTNTSADSSECFQFKPCYPTYLRFMGGWAWIFALFFAYTQSTVTPGSRLCHLARCFDRLTLGRLAPRGTLALVRWLAMAVHSRRDSCHRRGDRHLLYDGLACAGWLASLGRTRLACPRIASRATSKEKDTKLHNHGGVLRPAYCQTDCRVLPGSHWSSWNYLLDTDLR